MGGGEPCDNHGIYCTTAGTNIIIHTHNGKMIILYSYTNICNIMFYIIHGGRWLCECCHFELVSSPALVQYPPMLFETMRVK